MGARNDQSVFDLITNGWRRKVIKAGGDDYPGISIPTEYADEQNINLGDDVAIRPGDEDGVLELHFE